MKSFVPLEILVLLLSTIPNFHLPIVKKAPRKIYFSNRKEQEGQRPPHFENQHSSKNTTMICQVCEKISHTIRRCCPTKKLFVSSTPIANLTITIINSTNWLLDIGTSHHVTYDLNIMSLNQTYEGLDEIVIGDGRGLTITHVGKTTLLTSSYFSLSDVLCVPTMEQSLIFALQFCKTNNSFI